MAKIDITKKLIGSLSEAYYKEYCDQTGWAYISLEQIHERGIKKGILKFKKGFDRVYVKIPEEIIPEIEEISKPTSNSTYDPSYVYDFLACNVGNNKRFNYTIETKKKHHFVWVEVKTGLSNLTPSQIKTLQKLSLRLYRFRVPYPLGPADEVDIYKDIVDSKFLINHGLVPQGGKTLVLRYELAWRTEEDKRFMKSKKWKRIRTSILDRDNFTCRYCGATPERQFLHINHIDGNPKDHTEENLEVICAACHKIAHSGLWAMVFKTVDVYEESKFNQNQIVQFTGKMQEEGKSDDEIIEFLGLKKKVPWKQDLSYLSSKFGFITSRKMIKSNAGVALSEEQQKESLTNRSNW